MEINPFSQGCYKNRPTVERYGILIYCFVYWGFCGLCRNSLYDCTHGICGSSLFSDDLSGILLVAMIHRLCLNKTYSIEAALKYLLVWLLTGLTFNRAKNVPENRKDKINNYIKRYNILSARLLFSSLIWPDWCQSFLQVVNVWNNNDKIADRFQMCIFTALFNFTWNSKTKPQNNKTYTCFNVYF